MFNPKSFLIGPREIMAALARLIVDSNKEDEWQYSQKKLINKTLISSVVESGSGAMLYAAFCVVQN